MTINKVESNGSESKILRQKARKGAAPYRPHQHLIAAFIGRLRFAGGHTPDKIYAIQRFILLGTGAKLKL